MRPAVDDLFHRLADLSTVDRARYLSAEPRGVDTLREVDELLAHDSDDDDPLTPAIRAVATGVVRSLDGVGIRCGAFQLTKMIGRGGMGVVYFAERADGEVRQHAAVKLLQPGSTDAHRERFLQEREILAALSHANIARLLDADIARTGSRISPWNTSKASRSTSSAKDCSRERRSRFS